MLSPRNISIATPSLSLLIVNVPSQKIVGLKKNNHGYEKSKNCGRKSDDFTNSLERSVPSVIIPRAKYLSPKPADSLVSESGAPNDNRLMELIDGGNVSFDYLILSFAVSPLATPMTFSTCYRRATTSKRR